MLLLKDSAKKKRSYTPVIVGLCFLMVFTCLGFCSSTKSLFVAPVTEALGISRSAFSLNDSCRFLATATVNIFFGTLVAHFGPKKLIGAGFASLIASSLVYSMANNVFGFYVGGVLLGVGLSWTTTTMVGCVINRWCFDKKGTVMGAVLAANGLGGALATQLVSPVIYSGDSPFSYRKAYLLIAAVLFFVGVIIMIFFKDKPSEPQEQISDGKSKKRGKSVEGIEYSKAVRTVFFYGAAVCIFITGLVLQGITGVAAAHLKDVGIDPAYVATVLSVHSLALAFFKFLTGIIYDKFGLRTTVTICCTTSVIVMILLALVTNTAKGLIFAMIYGIFSALALPLETIMLPIYASDLFGEKSFNQVLGIFVSVNTAGYALGAPLINLCFDLFGNYKIGFLIGAALMLAVTVSIQVVISAANRAHKNSPT